LDLELIQYADPVEDHFGETKCLSAASELILFGQTDGAANHIQTEADIESLLALEVDEVVCQ
jgi:hypothetical protein